MPDNVPQLLTLVAVAKLLSVSPHTVRSWVKKGRLRPIRLCRRLIFHPEEITRFLAEANEQDGANCHSSSTWRAPMKNSNRSNTA